MNINSCVNEVDGALSSGGETTNFVGNLIKCLKSIRRRCIAPSADDILRPSPPPVFLSLLLFFSHALRVVCIFIFYPCLFLSPVRRTRPLFPFFLYIFIIYIHASRVSHAVPSFWYIETLIHPFPGTTPA